LEAKLLLQIAESLGVCRPASTISRVAFTPYLLENLEAPGV